MSLVETIKQLQKEIGTEPDGKWGPKTEAALKIALAKGAPAPAVTGDLNERSLKNLASCHPDLLKIAEEARKHFDFTVIQGHRNKADQDKAFSGGFSKVKWPNSKHNKTPAQAFDACPNPINFDDVDGFRKMRVQFQAAADRLGIKVKFISWDWPHIQLA